MEIKVIGTGSKGNCYILTNNKGSQLMLDCGLPYKTISKGLNYNIQKLKGCLITHEHKDHCLSVDNWSGCGIEVFTPYTMDNPYGVRKYGDFTVQTFEVPHNGTKCFGFYIKTEGQKILYLTDLSRCPLSFKDVKVNHILVECNFQMEYINTDGSNFKHKSQGHHSLDECIHFIQRSKTGALMTVILVHGGQGCVPSECVAKVKAEVGEDVNVYFAEAGMEISLNDYSDRYPTTDESETP